MDEKTKELLLFTINEKANQANSMVDEDDSIEKYNFLKGQYHAFIEMYSMIKNM